VTGIDQSMAMTNTRQDRKTYDVHIFTQVRVKVCEVEASGHATAIKKAEQQVDFHALFLNRPGYGACETNWVKSESMAGKDTKAQIMFTRVYVKKGGQWQSVAFQQTRVSNP
jgi:hypothetical protein